MKLLSTRLIWKIEGSRERRVKCKRRASCILCIPGGQLGLWVGISVITMCEILGMISQLIQQLCAKCDGNIKHDINDKNELNKLNSTSKEDGDI